MAFIVSKARAFETGIRTIENILSNIGMALLFILMVLGAGDVIGRYVFNSPIFGALEFEKILMGGVVFLGWAYVLAKRAHVTVDIVFRHYPPRLQAIIGFTGLLLSLVPFSLIIWQSGSLAIAEWQAGRLVSIILIPVAPFKLLVPFGAFFLCLECIIQMVHLVPEMSGEKEA